MNRKGITDSSRIQQIFYQKRLLFALTGCMILFGVFAGSSIMAAGKSKASAEHTSFKYYTSIQIKQGDTLWSIATDYISPEYDNIQTYIAEVKELNQLGHDDIHSGHYLMIPYYSSEVY